MKPFVPGLCSFRVFARVPHSAPGRMSSHGLAALLGWFVLSTLAVAAPTAGVQPITADARGVLERYCFDCHARGAAEGDLALDKLLGDSDRTRTHASWLSVWKNLRAQTMPPADEAQPSDAERQTLIRFIEREIFRLDPADADPGRVTIRRLNRLEYSYTISDLLGVAFDANENFPPDDTGYGFDTIGDVLSISPLLMEKYFEAARSIVASAVPVDGPQVPRRRLSVDRFRVPSKSKNKASAARLPFASHVRLEQTLDVSPAGRYTIRFEMRAIGSDEATANTANVTVAIDGQSLKSREIGWDNAGTVTLSGTVKLASGKRVLSIELQPLDPPGKDEDRLYLNVRNVEVQGPLDGPVREYPSQFRRVFFSGPPPADPAARRVYAAKILRHFAERAFRRPVDQRSIERLLELGFAGDPQLKKFEQGIATGLTAILVSPRFLYRYELQAEPERAGRSVLLDEFALASRLSYFLWSSLPDDELFALARSRQLRLKLDEQIDRLLDDPRSTRFVESFVGQWLQTRDVAGFNVDFRRVLGSSSYEAGAKIFNQQVRRALSAETQLLFAHLVAEDRSVLDLLTADYSFLNAPLAKFYGISGVSGDKMRKVQLPAGSHRGGVLTHAGILLVTSNPTLTSPVKRGLFVLENLLGTPSPPPPPDVPPLPETGKGKGRKLTLRQLLEVHRQQPLCASCHARMDPIGLAMEEYNALGMWRDNDLGKPIDTAGQLITGEKFKNTRDLAKVIANERRGDFYRCLTEKMLTYALGRGIEYYDGPTVDKIVAALEHDGGKMRTLVRAIVDSAPFQKRRAESPQQLSKREPQAFKVSGL